MRSFAMAAICRCYATGAAEQHVIAYLRNHRDREHQDGAYQGKTVIVAVPRFACTLMKGDTELPLGKAWKDWVLPLPADVLGEYRNIFTGTSVSAAEGELPLAQLFESFPVAVLMSEG